MKNGLPDGNGKCTYLDGTIYEGEWKKGVKDGDGVFIYSNRTYKI